jgi:phosphosulfolactate synthase (CoM biosynthesis protein A)
MAEQIASDLTLGAEKVIVEAREAGRGIGIYDEEGRLRGERWRLSSHLGKSRRGLRGAAAQPAVSLDFTRRAECQPG